MDLTADCFDAILPKEHYQELLKLDTRPDGRELGEFRKLTLNVGSIGTAHGSALVQLGDTLVVCGVKGELTKPPASDPEKGVIVPNVELSPLCAAHFKPGPPSEQAQVTSQFLYDLLKSCSIVDLEKLCLQKAKLAWVLYCDIVCLNYDGNLYDACAMALIAALLNTRLPEVLCDEETDTVKTNPDKRVKLHIKKKIFSTTYVLFDSSCLIADPTWKEEKITSGMTTIVTDEDGVVCNIHRPGGFPMSEKQMQKCIRGAVMNGKKLQLLLTETMS